MTRDRGYTSSATDRPIPAVPVGAGAVEAVNHPQHYGGDTVYEVIKVLDAWGLGFCLGNAVKYIARAGKKGNKHIEDLEKARWYIDHELQRLRAEDQASLF